MSITFIYDAGGSPAVLLHLSSLPGVRCTEQKRTKQQLVQSSPAKLEIFLDVSCLILYQQQQYSEQCCSA